MPFLVPILQSYNKFSEKMVMRENEGEAWKLVTLAFTKKS